MNGAIPAEGSRSPEKEETEADLLAGKLTLSAGVEVLSESTLVFTLLAVGVGVGVERRFKLSSTEGASERAEVIAKG